MENKTLKDLTPEEREELRNSLDKTTIDEVFMDLFCEIFDVVPNMVMAGEGRPNDNHA